MPPGKLAAQAGHAFCHTLWSALASGRIAPDAGGQATRIVLDVRDLHALERTYVRARAAGLPCVLFTDSSHVFPPHFDGSPVVTALGLGPCRRAEARPIVRRFSCLR